MLVGLALPLHAAEIEPIEFPQENVSDFRGVVNTFHAFRRACLEHPPSRELAEALLPEGYSIVPSGQHYGFEGDDIVNLNPVLTKSGLEETDWAEGNVIIHLTLPSDARPRGGCRVEWKRGWDYDEKIEQIIRAMHPVIDLHVSYHLEAVLMSRPDWGYQHDRTTWGGVSDWYSPCYDAAVCTFRILSDFDVEDGISLSLDRRDVLE